MKKKPRIQKNNKKCFSRTISIRTLVEYISKKYLRVAEIGIGHFPDIALMLKQNGIHVFATDIRPFHYDDIHVYTDDVTNPSTQLYRGRELLYSYKPPVELVPYIVRLAKNILSDVLIKPLSSEYPDGTLIRYENTTFFTWEIR